MLLVGGGGEEPGTVWPCACLRQQRAPSCCGCASKIFGATQIRKGRHRPERRNETPNSLARWTRKSTLAYFITSQARPPGRFPPFLPEEKAAPPMVRSAEIVRRGSLCCESGYVRLSFLDRPALCPKGRARLSPMVASSLVRSPFPPPYPHTFPRCALHSSRICSRI